MLSPSSHWPIHPALFLGLRLTLAAYTLAYLVVEMTPLTAWQFPVTNQTVVCGGPTVTPTAGPTVSPAYSQTFGPTDGPTFGSTPGEVIVSHNVTISGFSKFTFFTVWSYTVMVLHFTVAFVLSVVFYQDAKLGTHGNSENDTHSVMATVYDGGHNKRSVDNVFDNKSFTGQENRVHSVDNGNINNSSYDLTNDNTNSTHWYFKVSWVLASVISPAAPIVTTVFFTSIYQGGASIGIGDVNVHLLNLVFVFVDFVLSARPVRLLHCYLPFGYASLYLVFTAIYWCVTGDHVYDILNLDCPVTFTIWTFALGVATLGLQLLYVGLYQMKLYILKKINE